MRVNVYGEELTERVELVTKTVETEHPEDSKEFYGIRFWLKFPNQDWWVHRKYKGVVDDDSSALTIWASSKRELKLILGLAMIELEKIDS